MNAMGTTENDVVAEAGSTPATVALPASERTLDPATIAVESTRFVVGFATLVGEGLVALLERYGIPAEDLFEGGSGPEHPDPDFQPSDALLVAVCAALGLVEVPAGSPAPRRRVLTGALFDMPDLTAKLAGDLRRRTARVRGLAQRMSRLGPVELRVRRAQELLDRWHEVGSAEIDASRQYATAVLDGSVRLGMGWIVDNLDLNRILAGLELTDVIVESTGGVTERTLESVRSQAVGADGLVERIVARVLRRDPGRFPKGPPALAGIPEAPEGENGTEAGQTSPGSNGTEPGE